MADELISEFIDRTGIEGDKKYMLETLNEILGLYNKINGTKITLDSSKSLKDAAAASKQYADALQKLEAANGKLIDTEIKKQRLAQESEKTEQQRAKTARERQSAAQAAVKTEAEVAKQMEIQERYTKRLLAEKEKLTKATEKERKEGEKLNNAYEQLKVKYNEAANQSKRFGAAYGTQSQMYKDITAEANKYYAQLMELEKAVGQNQRNVGNYTQATFALNQVLREAPAFANSFATGISAISNNIPILNDEFKKLSAAINENTGKANGNLKAFQIMAGSLLSFSTILPLAFLLIQSYGKEIAAFAKSLVGSAESMDKFKESQKLLNKVMSEGSGAYQDAVKSVNELKINIDLAKKGLIDKKAVVEQYNESIGKVTGEVKNLDEAEKELTRNGDAYIKMMLYKAAANLALEEAATKAYEAEKIRRADASEARTAGDKILDLLGNVGAGAGAGRDAKTEAENQRLSKQANENRKKEAIKNKEDEKKTYLDIAKDLQQYAADIAKKYKFNFFGDTDGSKTTKTNNEKYQEDLKAQFELRKKALQDEIDTQKAITDNEALSAAVRTKARKEQLKFEQQLLREETQLELTLVDQKEAKEREQAKNSIKNKQELAKALNIIAKNATTERQNIEKEAEGKEAELKAKSAIDIISIRKQISDKEKEEIEALNKWIATEIDKQNNKEIKAAQQRLDNTLAGLEGIYNSEMSLIVAQYKKGEINKEQYEAGKLKIENKYRRESLLAEIAFYEDILKIVNLSPEEQAKAQKKLNELKKQLRRDDLSDEEKAALKSIEIQKKKNELYKQLANELKGLAFDILNAGVEKRKNELQQEMDALDKKKQKEIEIVNASVASQQDKANQIAIIEARANAQKEQLEKRRRQLEQEKARYDKMKAIADIVQNTTIAVVGALKPDGFTPLPARIAMAATIGAIGAAQLARVLVTPIPKYATGTEDHPGGAAIMGDGGKRELVIEPSGKTWVTDNKPTLYDLPKHSKVLPDAALAMQFAMNKTSSIKSMAENYRAATFSDDRLNTTLNKGFNKMVSELRRIPQPVQTSGGNKDLLLKHGSDYYKYI